jgi:hypothetical protein
MKRKLRSIKIGLLNFWKWRKVIYKDRDWDHWFIYEVLKTKLQFQLEHLQKFGYHEHTKEDQQKILECIDLINKVQSEYYINEGLEEMIDEKWTHNTLFEIEQKHNNARKELFKLLEQNIEYWWN